MITVTRTLDQLVAETSQLLQQPAELSPVLNVSTYTSSATTIQFNTQAEADSVARTDLLENTTGYEVMFVSVSPTDNGTTSATVVRGYDGSIAAAGSANLKVQLNPTFPRHRIASAIQRSFSKMEALGVPLVKSGALNRLTGNRYIEVPAETRRVLGVSFQGSYDGAFLESQHYKLVDNLPTTVAANGKALQISRAFQDADDIIVTYTVPYRWLTGVTYGYTPFDLGGAGTGWLGTSTVEVPQGAEELPVLYARAFLVGGRETSRLELDRAEEWNRQEAGRGGASLGYIRQYWTDFYRALDEAKRTNAIPPSRPYRSMTKAF